MNLFTGIIEEQGTILQVTSGQQAMQLEIGAQCIIKGSIPVDGTSLMIFDVKQLLVMIS